LTNNPAFGSGSGAAIYGGATYKSIQFVDQISGGTQIARFYNSGGTLYNNLNGLVISNTLSSPSNYQGSYTIQRTIPYAYNLNYHGFTDQIVFNSQSAAFNSFGSFVTIGNDRFKQDHYAGAQIVWYKDSSNTIGKIYDFVSAVSEMREGTVDTLFRFKVFEATVSGGTIGKQYGIQIPELTAATTNYGIVSMTKNGFGTYTPDSMVTTTSFHSAAGVRMDNLPTGGVAADSLLVITSAGVVKKRDASSLVGGSSITIDSLTYSNSTSTLTLNVTGQSDVSVSFPGSYVINAVHPDSISKQINDSTLKLKAVTVSTSDAYLSINTTRTDSTITHDIVRNDVSEPLFSITAGAGFASDTTIFTDSTLYGSFYTGQDSIYITEMYAVLKGQSGDTLGIQVVYNDTINAIDLFIDLPCYFPKIKVSHRARKMHGDIIDITIKTKSQNPDIKSEYDKLLNFALGNTNPWYYFYCFYDEDKGDISKYIIYDLRVLIKLPEFKDKSIFAYKDDKFNTKDGGSYFNCITVNKLIEKGVVVADWSKGEGEVKYYI